MNIKKNDFIELNYTGRIKEDNKIFDTTDEKTAKENNIFNSNFKYKPVIIIVGEHNIVAGLDKALEGKEINKEYKVEIKAEEAFGKKTPKLFQLVNTNKFRAQNINPMPGLSVNIDGLFGIIKTVTGGRTLVDFNHPLAGKDLTYEFKINRIVENDEEKVKALLNLMLNKDINIKIKEDILDIDIKLEKALEEKVKEKVNKLIPNIKRVNFKEDNRE